MDNALHFFNFFVESFDRVVFEFLRSFESDPLTKFFILFTNLGTMPAFIAVMLAAGALLVRRCGGWGEAGILLFSLVGSWLLNLILKELVARPRPSVVRLVEADGYSFPSGHAMVSTAFYGMIGFLLWVHSRGQGKDSRFILPVTAGTICLIGISRIYLGVHYASDVLAGFAAGILWLAVCLWLYRFRCIEKKET
jgi:undecaprenyl-diphosphatase